MKTDIIIAGVGGQGILSIATVIGLAALHHKMHVKQAETHGMSQRGGAVVSHLRLNSEPIYSDLIPFGQADIIIAVEPLEALRYLNYLSPNGHIITNTTPLINITDYPTPETLNQQLASVKNLIKLDADEMAANLKSKRSSNMVVLGAAVPFLNGIGLDGILQGIETLFKRKGDDVVAVNAEAVKAGFDFTKQNFQ